MVSSSRATSRSRCSKPARKRSSVASTPSVSPRSRSWSAKPVDVGDELLGDVRASAAWSACRVRRYAEQLPSGSPARRSTAQWVRPLRPSSASPPGPRRGLAAARVWVMRTSRAVDVSRDTTPRSGMAAERVGSTNVRDTFVERGAVINTDLVLTPSPCSWWPSSRRSPRSSWRRPSWPRPGAAPRAARSIGTYYRELVSSH